MSLALRHQPEKFGLRLREQGYVSIDDLLEAMRRRSMWRDVNRAAIDEVVRLCEKQRYEIVGDSVRARYGHSVLETIEYEKVVPPEILFHGTSPEAWESIKIEGIRPMRRQYAHHSTYVQQAETVGLRHSYRPVIIEIRALAAHEAGVVFYQPEWSLYLSDAIPPRFLGLCTESKP